MCNPACIEFVKKNLIPEEVFDERVMESGSRNVNGSVRSLVLGYGPREYIGTDIVPGESVDKICDAVDLVKTFGEENFNVLISTEVVEHVQDWRTVISNYKRILKPGGVLFITTRSFGFEYHGYPHDWWRYEVEDMEAIFEDFRILALVKDPSEPGVFIKARKPEYFTEKNLKPYGLYSINTNKRETKMHGDAPLSHLTGVPGWETHDEQDLLRGLASNSPGPIVEIGAEFGMSSSIWNKYSKQDTPVYSIDLFPGDMLQRHRDNLNEIGMLKSTQIMGSSHSIAPKWANGDYEDTEIGVLFIDGDHSYEGVKRDIEEWVKFVMPGGWVVFHDCACETNMVPHPLHYEVSRAVNEWFAHAGKEGWSLVTMVDTTMVFKNNNPPPEPVKKAVPAKAAPKPAVAKPVPAAKGKVAKAK